MPISLNRDGDRALVEFDYNNATKNKSKKGGGFYYTFAINGGDKMHVNRHAFLAIQTNWVGKNGVMKLERLGEDSYAIEAQSQGDTTYPLELKQWNTSTNGYEDVPGWSPGQDPEDGGAPAQQAPQQQQAAPQQQAPAQPAQGAARQVAPNAPAVTWDDLGGLMGQALNLAAGIWEHEGPTNVTGDVAGAIERMAVSLYIDARKMGLAAPGKKEPAPMQEAVQQVVAAMDGQVEDAAGGEGTDFGDDLPFS